MGEIENYINANQHLAKLTQKSYRHSHSKILRFLGKDKLEGTTQRAIINAIEKNVEPASTKRQLLNTAIQLRRYNDEAVAHMLSYRDKLQLELDRKRYEQNKEMVKDLPTFSDLRLYLRGLYKNDDLSFIINYLLIELNVRNKDCDCEIVENMRQTHANDKENYLVIQDTGVWYVRNNYKTFKIYGTKKIKITSKKFLHSVKSFYETQREKLGDEVPIYLMAKASGERVGEDSIQKFITSRTLEGLTEGDINKISVSRVDKIGDLSKLKKISKNRGTSVENLIEYYNLNMSLN